MCRRQPGRHLGSRASRVPGWAARRSRGPAARRRWPGRGVAPVASPPMASYQSLYRRYRPQRFDEVLGQDHVTKALRNAVRDGRVGHAYLFSGPRGTGKTSTARILAKVLNCAAPVDGEPCGKCENCVAVAEGRVVDWLLEQDAASKSKVDDMRDLLERVPLGTSGNRKVIILDEVHMLSQGAENALLKTLEEPPAHVVFVLATTDPQKVRPTIRSRTQHFEFRLLPPDLLADHVRHVIADAGLGLDDADGRRGRRPGGPQRRRVGPRHPLGARPGGRARRGRRRGRAGRRRRRRPRRRRRRPRAGGRGRRPGVGTRPAHPGRGRHRRPARRLPLGHGGGRQAPGARRAGAGGGRRRGARPGGADPGARRAGRGADRAVPQARPPRRRRGRPGPAHRAGRRPHARRRPRAARPPRTRRRRGRRTGGWCGARGGGAAGGSRWRSRARWRDALGPGGWRRRR